ncbi:MAG TPA: cytochrome c [Thermoanaerobaculia bacterium]|nr:cytochrome c [Thermoanaerobaculia bacterium]
MRVAVNSLLFVMVLALLSLNWVLRADPNRRNFEFLPNMARSIPFDSFSSNPNFADNMTLRRPVPGVVIHGIAPLHYAATPADAQRAGRELTNPFRDGQSLQRGAATYATYCLICHGPSGKGDGTVAQRGFPAPPSLLAPRARGLADGQIFHIITYGQNNMPSYASQVEREDRWKAILYVRDLQRKNQ